MMRNVGNLLVAICWLAVIAVSFGLLEAYKSSAGDRAESPAKAELPKGTEAGPDRESLILALHPRCPCSTATVEELCRVLARRQTLPEVSILLYCPKNAPAGWEQGRLAEMCKLVPGAALELDPEGIKAAGYGAWTSGHVVLYSAMGRLLFSGGILDSRGHEGDNASLDALRARLDHRAVEPIDTAVFGCGLGNKKRAMEGPSS